MRSGLCKAFVRAPRLDDPWEPIVEGGAHEKFTSVVARSIAGDQFEMVATCSKSLRAASLEGNVSHKVR